MSSILYPYIASDYIGNWDEFKTEKEAIDWSLHNIHNDIVEGGFTESFTIYKAVKVVEVDESITELEDQETEKLRARVDELTEFLHSTLDDDFVKFYDMQVKYRGKQLLEKDWK